MSKGAKGSLLKYMILQHFQRRLDSFFIKSALLGDAH